MTDVIQSSLLLILDVTGGILFCLSVKTYRGIESQTRHFKHPAAVLLAKNTSCYPIAIKQGVKGLQTKPCSLRKEEVDDGNECCV